MTPPRNEAGFVRMPDHEFEAILGSRFETVNRVELGDGVRALYEVVPLTR